MAGWVALPKLGCPARRDCTDTVLIQAKDVQMGMQGDCTSLAVVGVVRGWHEQVVDLVLVQLKHGHLGTAGLGGG